MSNGDDFDRDFEETAWETVYERQRARSGVVSELCSVADLEAGDTVLDIGSGPGYTAIQLANYVAPGPVYAIDQRRDALQYCLDRCHANRIWNVHPIVSDATALAVSVDSPITVFVSFVLHHVSEPERVISAIREAIANGSSVLITEYHPNRDGEYGPPLDHRIAPETIVDWLEDRSFQVERSNTHPEEKYSVLATRV